MRLEFEHTSKGAPANGSVNHQSEQEKFAECLNAGVRAAQAGDRKSARRHLMSALDIDSQSENAWLWLASISEYPEELLVFLNNVLDINPNNERALQWSASTKLLLSKTLVQRGIDANENGRRDFAVQCFDQALSYDTKNITAWLWLASLADNEEIRMESFRRVLDIDPSNETARSAIETAEANSRATLFSNAAWCAVKGDSEGAYVFLERIGERWPDDPESCMLKSHLAGSFDEKSAALQRLLEVDPENAYAVASLETLGFIQAAAGSCSRVSSFEPSESTNSTNHLFDEANTGDLVAPDIKGTMVEFVAVPENAEIAESHETVQFEIPHVDADVLNDSAAAGALSAPVEVVPSLSISTNGFASHEYMATEPYSNEVGPNGVNDPSSSLAEPIETILESEEDDEGVRVLIAQNNPTARKLMAGKLASSGYKVICAESGREAIDLAMQMSPALVLADIAMPGMDGYAICRSLRDRAETQELPVVLISGKDAYYEEDLGKASGVSGFITKPFGPETLMKTIESFLATTNQ